MDPVRAYANEYGFWPDTVTEAIDLIHLRATQAIGPDAARHYGYSAANHARSAFIRALLDGRGAAVAARYARRILKRA